MVMSIDNFTNEQLQAELARRNEITRREGKPRQLETVDDNLLRRMCQEHIDTLYKQGYVDNDSSQCVFEAALTTFFGKGVWEWINAQYK